MTIRWRRWAAAILAALAALGGACRRAAPSEIKPSVAATIYPLYDIVREIGGNDVRVTLILPPGASPHTFEPNPAAVAGLSGAAAVFQIGHGLDDWGAAMAKSAGVPMVVTVDQGIALRRFAANEKDPDHPTPGDIDPHYFLTIPNAKKIAETVDLSLSRIAPRAAPRFAERRAGYVMRLQRIGLEIQGMLANLPIREIATFHNAFGYFAQEYGLKVAATFEPYPGREPGPQDIVNFERQVREKGLKVIFAEPQMSVDGIAPIARDLGVRLSMLDDMGGVPGRESFGDMMLFNARQIAAACGRGEP